MAFRSWPAGVGSEWASADVAALATEFARHYGDWFMPEVRLAPALLEAVQRSERPVNVRQRENAVARGRWR